MPRHLNPTQIQVRGNQKCSRKLMQKAGTIPVDQYNTVRTVFEKIRAGEQSPVVPATK